MIIKFLNQLLQAENLSVILRGPAQKCNIVYNRLCDEALLQQILKGGMSASLGKLLVVFICNQGQMDINGNLPAECLIQTHIFRGRRKIFISSYHMGNVHGMVVYHVGKIVSGISV